MNEMQTTIERHVLLSPERVWQLEYLVQTRGVAESQIIERALDILFSLADLFDPHAERQGWSFLSEASLQRVRGNGEDALLAGVMTHRTPLRNHGSFLKGYVPEDEGLYDGYPSR